MNHSDAMIGMLMGVAVIGGGVTAKRFYALGPGQRPKPTTKTIPRRFGQLWCIGIGALLIWWSLPALRGPWHWRDLWTGWWFFAFFGVTWVLSRLFSATVSRKSEDEFQSLHLSRNDNDDSTAK